MSIKTKLMGVTFNNANGTSRQALIANLRNGEMLILRDLVNEKHPEAIGVYNQDHHLCGFIPQQLAFDLRAKHPDWQTMPVTVLGVTKGQDGRLGCNIEIATQSFEAKIAALDNDIAKIEDDYQQEAARHQRPSNAGKARAQRKPQLQCRKCGGTNVNVQAVSITKTKHRGVFYWLFFGWFFDLLLWIFLFVPRLLLALFGHKRIKTSVHSEAICQSCGYRWKV